MLFRRCSGQLWVLVCLWVLLFGCTANAWSAGTTTFYVSPQGRDDWSGQLPAPNAPLTDGPFASPSRARDAIRTLKQAGGLTQPVLVLLRGGTYYLPETLVFTALDSGTATCPITYAAYPGETPVLSGGQRLTGWRDDRVNGHPCWSTRLPDMAARNWYFKELFANGVRRPRTRLPKEGFYRFTGSPPGDPKAPAKFAYYAPGELHDWRNLLDVDLTALDVWDEIHYRLASVDEATGRVDFIAPCDILTDEKGLFQRYYVENVREALEDPGQWYLDRPTGKLYYLPLPGETPDTVEIVAPRLPCLVRLTGRGNGQLIHHLRLENLTFCHAEWNLPVQNPGGHQADTIVPGAIILRNAEDCAIFSCTVSQVGTYAIEVEQGCARNRIIACDCHDLGAGGVKVGHDSERTTVSDCNIHDGGLIYLNAVGIWVGNSAHNRIHHNAIYHLNYSGISCGWTWGYAPSQTMDNRIEYNLIHDLGNGLLSDIGGIYTLGVQPGTIIRGNSIYNITHYGYGGWGIYPDEGSAEMLIENNIINRTQSAGFHLNYGRDNLVRNNMFLFGTEAQLERTQQQEYRAAIFTGNIFYWKDGDLFSGSWADGHFLFVQNLYWKTTGDSTAPFNGHTLAEWQAWGQDMGGVIADPGFRNPKIGNYTVPATSPALKLGFQQFDLAHIGPRFPGKRPATLDKWPRDNTAPAMIVRSSLQVVEPVSFVAGARPGVVQLTVQNAGEARATGAVAVRITPNDAGTLTGEHTVNFALDPGQQQSVQFTVTADPNAESIAIETDPSGDAVIPTCLYLTNTKHAEWSIPRIPALTSAEQVPAALATTLPRKVRWLSRTQAEVRLAVAGADLALSARVYDANVTRKERFWEGSCLELFCVMPGDTAMRQLDFLPATPTLPGDLLFFENGTPQAKPPLRWQCTPTEDGYQLNALIPLKLMNIAETATQFKLEVAVSAAADQQRAVPYITLFSSTSPAVNVTKYGTVLVREK